MYRVPRSAKQSALAPYIAMVTYNPFLRLESLYSTVKPYLCEVMSLTPQ